MGSFGPELGSVVVSHQHGNTQVLKGCDASVMTLSSKLYSSSGTLNYQIMVNIEHPSETLNFLIAKDYILYCGLLCSLNAKE
jgi:hypothetical protein